MKKILKKLKTLLTKKLKSKKRPEKQQTLPSSPPRITTSAIDLTMPHPKPTAPTPFLFPKTQSTVLPDPSPFFSQPLLSSPLPTNSFFQNFVLKKGDQPEFIHPYLIKLSPNPNPSLSLCYPSRFSNPSFIYQIFNADITISGNSPAGFANRHTVTSFDDLTLTLDIPCNLRFFLARGCPFVTCVAYQPVSLSITSIHAFLSLNSSPSLTKHTLQLNNNQTWICYSSSPLNLTHSPSLLAAATFSGVLRFALLPDPGSEFVLDRFSSCYPVCGKAIVDQSCVRYEWEKKGWGELLLLAHPLHLKILSNLQVLNDFRYRSIDGDLVGVVGDSWVLQLNPVSVNWHSTRGVDEESVPEIVSALCRDVEGLNQGIPTSSSYFYGKAIARAARLAVIAEEICFPDAIPAIRRFLQDSITPWLDGNFAGNGFLYDPTWGGIVSKQGSLDSGADFGFGIYNDHHYHLGYFLYAIAVLAKLDPGWGRKYRPRAYALMADFMTVGRSSKYYPRLRNFDLWKLHSWAGGLTEFADGRNQESTSEAVNAYYSAALMGLSYGDSHLVSIGSTLTGLEILAAQTWWHVAGRGTMYEEEFTENNRVVGVLWANKRDSGLWFAPADWRECRLGIQVLPLLPITEVLFYDVGFVRDLVNWALPALEREGVGEGWKGFVYAMQGVYEKNKALQKIKSLNGHDDGNSLSNLLWWIHSRGDQKEEGEVGFGWRCSWFNHYCH